jgi:hypothetical protein
MKACALLPIAILFFGVCLQAQQPDTARKPDSTPESSVSKQSSATQPPDSAQPLKMNEWLNNGKVSEQVERLVSLGVELDVATEISQTTYVSAKWLPLRTGQEDKNAILFLPCVRDNAHLYLMTQENETWSVTDFEKPDCHYDMSVSVEVAPIRNPALDEILIHHEGGGHGAGYSQQDFEIYAVAHGKLKSELLVPEVIVAVQYVSPNVAPHNIIQKSHFVLVPIGKSRSCVVEETRSSLADAILSVQRRQFHWNAAKGRYLPSKFVTVEAAPN